MLTIWQKLLEYAPELFADAGPFCTKGECKEGRMCCGKKFGGVLPEIAELLYE